MATRKPKATPAAQDSTMPAPTEAPTGTWSIWKPADEEFYQDDFDAIAASLSLESNEVEWVLTSPIVNADIDGHVLSGTAKV